MYCTHCGQPLSPNCTGVCQNCGAPVQSAYYTSNMPPYYGQPQQPVYLQPPTFAPPIPKPSMNWLIVNIVLTVLSGCSNVLAIIGIVFGALAQNSYTKRNYAEAESNNKTCRIMGIISLVLGAIGVLLVVLYLVLIVAGVFGSLGSEYYM